jgi:hypothetical protein
MSNVKTLKSIFESIDYPCYVEFVDTVWTFKEDGVIYYNTDDSVEDLEEEDGETYSCELREGFIKHDDYLVANCDMGTGDTVTYFFNLEKEIK